MTPFEIAIYAALIVIIGVLLVMLRNRQPNASADLAELHGQLAQISSQSGAIQTLIADQMAQSEGRLGTRLEQSLRDQNDRTTKSLTTMAEKLAVITEANAHITTLTGQVSQLQNILSNKQARGSFGEVQLENLIKTVLPPNAYAFQVTLPNQKRADCVLKLPNPPGDIVIDSKFPLEAWHSLQNAETKAEQQAARKQLAIAVRGHVKDIQEKYIVAGTTAESACLFLPSEAVYAELHANMPDVIEASYKARVWIVSPTTMMATLNTVRAVLRDARMREQTAIIQAEMLKLLEDVSRLDTRVDNLNRHFSQAQKDITEIQTSTTRITKRSHKITELDVSDDEDISVIETEVKPAPTLSPATDTPS